MAQNGTDLVLEHVKCSIWVHNADFSHFVHTPFFIVLFIIAVILLGLIATATNVSQEDLDLRDEKTIRSCSSQHFHMVLTPENNRRDSSILSNNENLPMALTPEFSSFLERFLCKFRCDCKKGSCEWPELGNIRYFTRSFILIAEQASWITMEFIYYEHTWFCIVHLGLLLLFAIILPYVVYKESFENDRLSNVMWEILRGNTFLQTWRSAKSRTYTHVLENIHKWQAYWSMVFMIQYYIFGMKLLGEATSSWHGIMFIAGGLSTFTIAWAQLYRDKYGMTRPSVFWRGIYIIWRAIEFWGRVKLWAVVAAIHYNWLFVFYMMAQFFLILSWKMSEHTLWNVIVCGDRGVLNNQELKTKWDKFFQVVEESLFSLFFFDLVGFPSISSIQLKFKNLWRQMRGQALMHAPARPVETAGFSQTALSINILKLVEVPLLIFLIYMTHNYWQDMLSENYKHLSASDFCIAKTQSQVTLPIWALIFVIYFCADNFNINQLRESHAKSIYHLYEKSVGLELLTQMIVSGDRKEMTRDQNKEWESKGLSLDKLMRIRPFSPQELARLGFHIVDVFRQVKDKRDIEYETKKQLKEKANLIPDTSENATFTDIQSLFDYMMKTYWKRKCAWPRPPTDNGPAMLQTFRNFCKETALRLVLWHYWNKKKIDDRELAPRDDTFFDFDVNHDHHLFDKNWQIYKSDQMKNKKLYDHKLNSEEIDIMHVLVIPPVGDDEHYSYQLLKLTKNVPWDAKHVDLDYYRSHAINELESFEQDIFADITPNVPEDLHPRNSSQNSKDSTTISVPSEELVTDSREAQCNHTDCKHCAVVAARSLICCPCIWFGKLNNACCCQGGKLSTVEAVVGDRADVRVRTGDTFLTSTYDSQYLSLIQTGHWGHAALIYRVNPYQKHLLPRKFQLQIDFWLSRGHIEDDSILVFEITNHEREWDRHCAGHWPAAWERDGQFPPNDSRPTHKNNGARLTTLDSFLEDTRGPYGNHTSIGIRSVDIPRDAQFYKKFFELMQEVVDKPYTRSCKQFFCKLAPVVTFLHCWKSDEELFCSELVARFYERIELTNGIPPATVVPSDLGNRRGPWPCCFMCPPFLCLAYLIDDRALKYKSVAVKHILDQPLYILDNSSVTAYKDMKLQNERNSKSSSQSSNYSRIRWPGFLEDSKSHSREDSKSHSREDSKSHSRNPIPEVKVLYHTVEVSSSVDSNNCKPGLERTASLEMSSRGHSSLNDMETTASTMEYSASIEPPVNEKATTI